MRLRIVAFAITLPLAFAIPAEDALAACAPAAGPNVTCSGVTTSAGDGFGDGTQSNFAINVLSGATVTGLGGSGLVLSTDNNVTNAGTITGLAGHGIDSAFGFLNVFNSGVISAPAGNGIIGPDVFVTNFKSGRIVAGASGVVGNNATVANYGTISGSTFGVNAVGGTANVFNSGSIISSAGFSINAFVDANVINSGTIIGADTAVRAVTGNVNLTNTGTVAGGLTGISALGGVATVTNYGAISGSLAPGGVGIIATQINLTNFGTISGDTGVLAVGVGNVLVNSGTIRGVFSSIDFSLGLGGDTLTFLPGSRLIGSVELGNGNMPSTVNIQTGRDIGWLITFGACGCGGIVENQSIVNLLGGAPAVIVGNRIATLDATAFGLADKNLMDYSGWISSLFGSRLGELGGFGGQGATAFAAASTPVVDKANEAFASAMPYAAEKGLPNASYVDRASGAAIWSKAFAGVRKQQGDDLFLESRSSAYGGAIGLDGQMRSDLRLGFFAGAGTGKFETGKQSQTIDTDYFFGGVYGRFDWNAHFLDFALTAGHSTNDNARIVANNMAPDGIETAKSKYDGWFLSPELAYGVRIPVTRDIVLTPIARVRYLTGHFDGYAETGSAQNLVVNNRDLQNLEERFELNVSRFDPFMAGIIRTTATAGVVGLQRVGDKNISTVLLGQNLAFATPGDDSSFGGFAGIGFDYRASQRVNLFAGVEGAIMDDKSRTAAAKAGARFAF